VTNPADPFATAATSGPVVRCLGHDRLIVVIPLRVEQQAIPTQYLGSKPPGSVSDVLVGDVIAIDGAPIMFGGDPAKGVADTEGPIMPGTPMREFRFYQTTLVSQLRGHIGQGPVIGRLAMSQTKSGLPNWKLTDPRPGDRQLALAPYQAYASGQFLQPKPQPAEAAVQPVHGVPPVGIPGVGTPTPQPAYTGGTPTPTPQPTPVAAADWTLNTAPVAGFGADQWFGFSQPQREQLLALNGITAPVAA
jgi:hypothetical protein